MENVKIWLIADTHFGLKGDDEIWLEDSFNYFNNDLIPYMKKNVGENDILIHCGDVFDNRSTIGLHTITKTILLFEDLSKIFRDVRIVVGNHDIFKKSTTDITALHALKHIPNVKVYFKPVIETICGKSCLFNPWVEDFDEERDLLNNVDVDYVFGHIQIGGTKTSDRGHGIIDTTNGVKKSDFKNAQVYAGHIHIKQDMKNIHYVGNPYHKDQGDIGNPKGITILEIETGKTVFIENKTSPKFIKDSLYDIINLTIGDLKERWKNNRVELYMKGTDIVRCNFDEMRNCLNKYYKSLDTIGDNTKIEELDTEMCDADFKDAKTSGDYMNDFLNQQDLEPNFRVKVDKALNEIGFNYDKV